jgi:tRNA threonylcarbamoyladenosine modification (KEOPS) complex Cgi121 subunit
MKKDNTHKHIISFIDALRQALSSICGLMNDEIDEQVLETAEHGLRIIDSAITFAGEDSPEAVIMQMAKIELRMDIIKARQKR